MITRLINDGLKVDPSFMPIELIRNDLNWEATCVEGPWIIVENEYYYLFYSANVFNVSGYSIGVARSRSLFGPYTKFGPPILHTDWNKLNNG